MEGHGLEMSRKWPGLRMRALAVWFPDISRGPGTAPGVWEVVNMFTELLYRCSCYPHHTEEGTEVCAESLS